MFDCAINTLEALKDSLENINIDNDDYVEKRKELIDFIINASHKIKNTNIINNIQVTFNGKSYLDIGNINSYIYEPSNQVIHGVMLFIPSPLNRGNIFDLEKDKSIVQFMCDKNYASVVLDWQRPACDYTLDDLVENLALIMQALYKQYNKPITLVGYCLGGILAASLAQKYSHYCKALVLIATPWNFSDTIFHSFSNLIPSHAMYNQPDFWRYLFFLVNPEKIYDKYINAIPDNFSNILETWLYDILPLPTSFNQQLFEATKIQNWYDVIPKINLHDIPIISAYGDCDYIVPYHSITLPKYFNSCNTTIISVNTGHIGLIISRKSKEQFWHKLPDIIDNL